MKGVIILTKKETVDLELQANDKGYATCYSTMHPVKSPYFKDPNDVVAWFQRAPEHDRQQFVNYGSLVIYSHVVDVPGRVADHYTTSPMEIVSTDEAYLFDFETKSWV